MRLTRLILAALLAITPALEARAAFSPGPAGGGTAPFRNRLINGNFAVNQRVVAGTVTLAAGAYGHDGWKAGAGGATYTFAVAANGDATATITAGTLVHPIEGALYLPEGGAYTASWSGSSTCRVYQGTATGSYAASPVVTPALTAGTNGALECGTGTLGLAQLEPGTSATPFERRDDELRRCQRYYEKSYAQGAAPGAITQAGAVTAVLTGSLPSASYLVGANANFRVTKRAVPALAFYSPNTGATGKAYDYVNSTDVTVTASGLGDAQFSYYATVGAASTSINLQTQWTASAEL